MPSVDIGMSLATAKVLTDSEARPRWNEPDSSTNFVAFMRRGAVEYDHRGADLLQLARMRCGAHSEALRRRPARNELSFKERATVPTGRRHFNYRCSAPRRCLH